MIRSGMAAIRKAFLYSGFFWKREEFSRVDVSSRTAYFRSVERSWPSCQSIKDKLTFVSLFELWLRREVRHGEV